MKLLQLHDESWDSGLAHYALTLSAELSRRGHEVHFWAASGSFAAKEAGKAGLAVRGLKNPWLHLPALRAEIRKAGVQLINAHTGSSHALAAVLSLGTPIPVARTRGDTRPAAGHPLARLLAARTSVFIAANSRIKDELARAFPGARVELVCQGLAPLAIPSAPALPEAPSIGILGRLDAVKGHEDLLDAAALLRKSRPEARFLAAGGGKPERLAELQGRARSLSLNGSVEFLGFVPDLVDFISRCRVGVVASTDSEAVSRAALEWMALGRPVVATRVGCLPDMIEDGKTGLLVPPGSAHALAEALRRLLEDPRLAAEMGSAAQKRFEALFSLKRFADQTETLYEDILRHLPR